jgi:hypothetical protein
MTAPGDEKTEGKSEIGISKSETSTNDPTSLCSPRRRRQPSGEGGARRFPIGNSSFGFVWFFDIWISSWDTVPPLFYALS